MKKFLTQILLVLAGTLFAGKVELVRDGKPRAEIILPSKATASAQMAAFELNYHIRLVTGIELPVTAKATGKFKTVIELGTDRKSVV